MFNFNFLLEEVANAGGTIVWIGLIIAMVVMLVVSSRQRKKQDQEAASMRDNLTVGDELEKGTVIGAVGDSSVAELAEEPHLHFEMLVKDVKVNPLDYISDESKLASLGIVSGSEA